MKLNIRILKLSSLLFLLVANSSMLQANEGKPELNLEARRQNNVKSAMIDLNDHRTERNTDLVFKLYEFDAVYKDPLANITGVREIADYFDRLNAITPQFEMTLDQTFKNGDDYVVKWRATLSFNVYDQWQADNLNYDGVTIIKFAPNSDKIISHQDIYDHSNVYEKVPLLGPQVNIFKDMMIGFLRPNLDF